MANSNSKAETKIQDKPGKCSKVDGDMPKGHRHQLEGVSTDKILDNWGFKVNYCRYGLSLNA